MFPSENSRSETFSLAPPPPPPPPPLPKADSNTATKLVHWKMVAPINLDKNCFWTNNNASDEQPLKDEKMFGELSGSFSSKKSDAVKKLRFTPTSTVDLKVLTQGTALNLSLLLRVAFKNVPFEQIIQYIINCDTSALSANFVEQLAKMIPKPHEIEKLHKLKKCYVVLSEEEEFMSSLCEIDRIQTRLECILFAIQYEVSSENIEPALKKATAACEELIASQKFGQILKIILSIGNYLNFGSLIGNAIGFELVILTQLNEIKTVDNKSTLLHFLVETIQNDYPQLFSFGEEIIHVKDAADFDPDKIEEIIQKLTTSSIMLKKEILANKDNKFIDAMSTISSKCGQRVEMLTELLNTMKKKYQEVAKYFAFDEIKFPSEQCFSTIRTFNELFTKEHLECNKKARMNQKIQTVKTRKTMKIKKHNVRRELRVNLKRMSNQGLYQ